MRPASVLLLAALLAPAAAAAVGRVEVRGLFKDRALLVIDGRQRLLRTGQTSPEGVKLISANSEHAVLEINGKRITEGLGSQIGGTFTGPRERSVQIWPTPDHMYPVVGSINGLTVDFIVDTGATLITMNASQARRLGIDYLVDGQPGLSSTASGLSKMYTVTLKRVRVGEIELRDVKAAVNDGNYPEYVLLGMSFLNRVDMQRQGAMLELRQRY